MSIYPPPKNHNGSLNLIFNKDDYIKNESSSSGTTQSFNDARYLKNTGIVISSAETTFNSSVNIAGLATIDSLDAKKIHRFSYICHIFSIPNI